MIRTVVSWPVSGTSPCPDQPGRPRTSRDWLLREAGPQDAELIRDFVCRLSLRSQYLRFFAPVAPPSSRLLRALCGGSADILVVTDSRGEVVAHGMAAGEGRDSTEIGLVVADDWQGRGLGTTLLRALVRRAADRGVRTLVVEVLPENRRMLGIISRRWPDAQRERTSDSIIFRAEITRGAVRADRSAA